MNTAGPKQPRGCPDSGYQKAGWPSVSAGGSAAYALQGGADVGRTAGEQVVDPPLGDIRRLASTPAISAGDAAHAWTKVRSATLV